MTVDTANTATSRMALEEILHAYRLSQVLITATELGVFEALHAGPLSRSEVAERCGADPVRLGPLCDALVAMDLLREGPDGCAPGPLAQAHLMPDAPSSLVRWVRSEAGKMQDFAGLTQALSAPGRARDGAPGEVSRPQQSGLADIARDNAASVATAVDALIPGGRGRLLDAGGGHGVYSVDLVSTLPGWTAVVADRPCALEVAAATIEAAGVGDRVSTREADLLEGGLGKDFDLAFLFMVLCGYAHEESLRVVRNIRDALRPGGWLLIRAFYWRDPLEEAMFSLKHLLHPDGAPALTRAQAVDLLAEAGFTEIHLLDEAGAEPGSLLAARRPEATR